MVERGQGLCKERKTTDDSIKNNRHPDVTLILLLGERRKYP